jgi:hypothetical protein
VTTLEAATVEYITLVVAWALLVFGVFLLFYLRRRGGPELALARLLADSRRRTIFLGALCASLAALFGIGMANSLGGWIGTSSATMGIVTATLFVAGAAGIFVLMVDALHTSPLTLEEEWNLKETAARVINRTQPVPPPIDMNAPPYVGERGPYRPGR